MVTQRPSPGLPTEGPPESRSTTLSGRATCEPGPRTAGEGRLERTRCHLQPGVVPGTTSPVLVATYNRGLCLAPPRPCCLPHLQPGVVPDTTSPVLSAIYNAGLCLAPPGPRSLPPTTGGCAGHHLARALCHLQPGVVPGTTSPSVGCHAQLVVVSGNTEPGPAASAWRPYPSSGSCSDAIVSRSTRADARRPSNSATERSIRSTRSTPSRWTTVGNDRYTSSMPL